MKEKIQRYIYLILFWIINSSLLFILTFFISPFFAFVAWLYLLKRFQFKMKILVSSFISLNLLIAIFCILSTIFWIMGPIHDISFSYSLYNILRWEWTYISLLWLFFLSSGLITLFKIKYTWEKLSISPL